jgi:hypothetical protein
LEVGLAFGAQAGDAALTAVIREGGSGGSPRRPSTRS